MAGIGGYDTHFIIIIRTEGSSPLSGKRPAIALDATAVATHMLATLIKEGFEPNVLPGVLGTLHHEIEDG